MTQREAVLATLQHKPVEFIPGYILFSTPQAEKILLPDIQTDPPQDRPIRVAKALGNCMINVNGHLRFRVVEEGENYKIQEYENGTRRIVTLHPEWFYETPWRPLDTTEDLDELHLPDVTSPERWIEQQRDTRRFMEEGFFVRGTLNGFYSAVWYYCRKYEQFAMDLAEGSDFVQALIDRWGRFVLESGRQLLECGVDGIYWTDDLGSNAGPLISPAMYVKYFFPWHKRAADLAHEYGKIAIMHSHGNINKLLPHIVETGIDVLDPVGPSDNMDLESLKAHYGDRISLMGGISRFIGELSMEELKTHLEEVYRVGCPGGGFIPMEEGGVPQNMPYENFVRYVQLRRELSGKYASIINEQ
ncbi:MAG: hypothetical protein KAR36_01800 [Candidatus Latescibacteria bacterium]|nr:hypothetical protein [Candidatus Latescibacterota bacterium]